jgi:hypothetical protein
MPRSAFFKISLPTHIWHICKATQANPQPKLYKRAKSPSLYNNYVLYQNSQVKADLIATNDNIKIIFRIIVVRLKLT